MSTIPMKRRDPSAARRSSSTSTRLALAVRYAVLVGILLATASSATEIGLVQEPSNDTASVSGTLHDITAFKAEAKAGVLTIEMRFAGSVSGADSGAADALRGYIDIDTDHDPTTGDMAYSEYLGLTTSSIGVEAWVDLSSYSQYTEKVNVHNQNAQVTGQADMKFANANWVTVDVPLSALGGGDGQVDLSAVVSNNQYNWTDAAPNQSGLRAIGAHQVFVNERLLVEVKAKWQGTDLYALPAFPEKGGPSTAWTLFNGAHLEVLTNVLDGCSLNNKLWVFWTTTNDLEMEVKVQDLLLANTATYTKPAQTLQKPTVDTSALPCS